MSRTLPNAVQSQEVRYPDRIGYQRVSDEAKGPKRSDGKTERDFPHGAAIWDVLVHGQGSVKSLASALGNKDESLARRQVQAGNTKLIELFQVDEAALCEFADYVLDTFRPALESPRQKAIKRVAELQKQLAQLQLDLGTEQP